MNRLGGRAKPSLTLGVGGFERRADLTRYEIVQTGGSTSYLDVFEGQDEPQYTLSGSAIQTTDSQSLWRFTWTNSGETVPFNVAPWGNVTPTYERPHYRGRVIIGPRPSLGGDASAAVWIFDFAWLIVGDVEEVIA